jgi:hypothetical protein
VVGLRRRNEPPRRRSLEPALAATSALGERRIGHIAVLPDDTGAAGSGGSESTDGLRAWYTAHEHAGGGPGVLSVAASRDGLVWEKPGVGPLGRNRVYAPAEWEAGTGRSVRQFEFTAIVRDPQATDPGERYRALLYFKDATQELNGFWLASSPDGLRWQRRQEPVIPIEGDASRLMWDPAGRRWLFTCRRRRMYNDLRARRPWKRTISLAESSDLVHWSPLAPILTPDDDDPSDTQLYNMLIVPRGDLYLGFMSVYHLAEERMDVQLAVSRDRRHWERPGRREPYFAPGPLGSWDDRSVHLAHSAPCVQGDQMRWWYSGSTTGHGAPRRSGAVGALEFERDRFAGLVTGIQPGEVVTEPVRLTGTRLLVNAAVGMGELRVELLDEVDGPPEGYTLADCDPLVEQDAVDAPVTWSGAELPAAWLDRPVRLRFRLAYGSLFGYRFA